MQTQNEHIVTALGKLTSILHSLEIRWVITTGFACYLHGIKRPFGDIDIDLDCSKDAPVFLEFVERCKTWISSPLEHFVDQNYDNWNIEMTVDGILFDLCTMPEMKIFDSASQSYRHFYPDGFPPIVMIPFEGMELPVLPPEKILEEKSARRLLSNQDMLDIQGLSNILSPHPPAHSHGPLSPPLGEG